MKLARCYLVRFVGWLGAALCLFCDVALAAETVATQRVTVRDGLGNTRITWLNAVGLPVLVVDGKGGESTMGYSALLNMTERRNQLNQVERWTYYSENVRARPRVSTMTRKSGRVIESEEDILGRQIRESTDTDERLFSYGVVSRLIARENSNAVETFVYDALDRVLAEGSRWKLAGAPVDYTNSFTYNRNGWMMSSQGPGGDIAYDHDQRGMVTRMEIAGVGRISFSYSAGGNLTEASLPGNVLLTYQRGHAARLRRMRYAHGVAGTLLEFGFDDDPRGNITWMSESGNMFGWTVRETFLGYDLVNRLRAVSPSQGLAESYEYDAEGNRTGGHQGEDWQYDAAHRMLASPAATYQYDADGSRISRTEKGTGHVIRYSYSAEGRLLSASGIIPGTSEPFHAQYGYDGQWRRIVKTVNGVSVYYAYNGQNLVAEYGPGGVLKTRWIYGRGIDNPLLMLRDTDGDGQMEVYVYLKNHLGTVLGLANASGEIVKQYTYDSFGNRLAVSGSADLDQPFTYTGREWDAELGLYYHRARHYDAGVGRFLQEDRRWSVQPYPYAKNNPMTHADPMGEAIVCDYFATVRGHEECNYVVEHYGYLDALVFYDIYKEADEIWLKLPARDELNERERAIDGSGDAFKHCYWSCKMTSYLGADFAVRVGDLHETASSNHSCATAMDLHNNQVGRFVGASGRNCFHGCFTELNAGHLRGLFEKGNGREINRQQDEFAKKRRGGCPIGDLCR